MTETNTPSAAATRLPGRVISGGQTGADQAGLIVARRFGLPTGGWMPRGWQTATGPNPQLGREFGLREHTGDYAARTAANVRASDGTIRLAASFQTLGERCTAQWLQHDRKPSIDVDIRSPRPVAEVVAWVRQHEIRVLNVAGNAQPRSRTALAHGITAFATAYLADLFRQLGHRDLAAGSLGPREREFLPQSG